MRGKRPKSNYIESSMIRTLDKLAEFDDFQNEIAPALRGAVKEGKTPEEIFQMVIAHVAARQATIALTSLDPKSALPAIKDILDRSQGKATEKREVKVSLESAPDEQIEAKLKSLLADTILDEEESKH